MMIQYPVAAGPVTTRVLEAGTGDDVVVLIHGLGARADRFARNIEPIAEAGFHCYAVDLPGHGFATKGSGYEPSVPGLTDVVEGFVESMGFQSLRFIGTSLGGHVAATYACRHPARVKGLILIGSLGLQPIGPETGAAIRDSVKKTDRESIEGKLRFVLADAADVTPAWIEEEARINNSPGAAEGFAALGDYIAERVDQDVVGPQLKELIPDIPTLLVWGAEDKAVPVEVGQRARDLLGAPLELIPATGHAPYFEDAVRFNRLAIDFLRGGSAA